MVNEAKWHASRAYLQQFDSLKVVHAVAFHKGTLKCDYPKQAMRSISIAKNNGFSYHCTKRIIEKDILGASIHCMCQCTSVMHE